MKLTHWLKSLLLSKVSKQSVTALAYPDKNVVITFDYTYAGFSLASKNVTILTSDLGLVELGLTVRHHLNLTKHGVEIPKDYSESYKEYLKSMGFKTRKQEYEGAKCVMIYQEGGLITLKSTKNGGVSGKTKGFQVNDSEGIVITSNSSPEALGKALLDAWHGCD